GPNCRRLWRCRRPTRLPRHPRALTLNILLEGMTMKRYLCSIVALVLLQGVMGQVKAQPTYRFTTFDVPGSSFIDTKANGINASGRIVGSNLARHYGFLLDNGSYTTLTTPGSTGTSANGINDSGQIVGSYDDAAGTHGFLLDNGRYTTLDVPGATYTEALGINATGQIVGAY